jgi:diguanylate cyclase (GGDEF)-like protein
MDRPHSASTQRILIVDDSPRARLLVEAALRAQGHDGLTSVESAQAAFQALGMESETGADPTGFDLILMDLLMPEVDGIEACRRIKSSERFTDVPVIMVTAEDSPECLKAAFDAGAMDYVKKPVNRVELAARVQSALRLKQETDCRKARERELVELTEKLRQLSNVDGLTQVANRRNFDEELARIWRRTQREGGAIALIMIDIDHFKNYNDHYGHLAGDECLRRVAEVLRGTVKRPFDLVARYGGEEFAVLLPDTHGVGAEMLAEQMRASVEALDILHGGSKTGRVTISCGVAADARVAGSDSASLIAMADRRLYQAKHAGRNRVAGFEEFMSCA